MFVRTMARAYRLDFGTLGKAERTPQGGLKIPADLTRAGVFTYLRTDGTAVNEWRPLAEVARAETLASLKGAPFTVGHPKAGRVEPGNFGDLSRGHVGDDVRQDGAKTSATIYAQHADALRVIQGGQREISCGYHQDTDETPGVVPAGEPDAGKPYDRIQRNITYNHVAVVARGRAGSDMRLRLDEAGDSTTGTGGERMDKIEIIDGVEYPVDTPAHRAARERADAASVKLKADMAALTAARDTERGRADAAAAELATVVAGAKKMLSPERLDAAVRTRAALADRAHATLGREFKVDGLTNREIKIAVANKVLGLRMDAADEKITPDYLRGVWSAIKAKAPGARLDDRKAKLPPDLRDPPDGRTEERTIEQVRQDSINERSAPRPFAMSRNKTEAA